MTRPVTVYWLRPPPHFGNTIYLDVAWMAQKCAAPSHNWIMPIIDWEQYSTVEQVVSEIVRHRPDVLCLSVYLWNERVTHDIAREVRRQMPDTTIVAGGPHQGSAADFFSQHPHVDYRCFPTGHGEYFIVPFLDQIAKHGTIVDPESVPYLASRTYEDIIISRKYEYPSYSIYEQNLEYVIECASVANAKGSSWGTAFETTRGCPYGCVFCEWGGGTSTKVSAKPVHVVEKDLEVLASQRIDTLEIVDANFGILPRDVEIAKKVVSLNQSIGSPSRVYVYGVAKTSLEKRMKALTPLYDAGLVQHRISIQTTSANAMKDINRTDLTIDQYVSMAADMYTKYQATMYPEFILGLPGYRVDDFFDEMDLLQRLQSVSTPDTWKSPRYTLQVLPGAPIMDPKYIKDKEIVTVTIPFGSSEEYNDPQKPLSGVLSNYDIRMPTVVQTYSYTVQEWCEMYIIGRAQLVMGPMVRPTVKASDAFRRLRSIVVESSAYEAIIKPHMNSILTETLEDEDIACICGRPIEDIVLKDIAIPHRVQLEEWFLLPQV